MGKSKTCIIHGPGHSSYECKVLRDLGLSILKVDLLKTVGTIPYQKQINRHQDNNAIVISAVDEIFLHENQKVSAEKEARENVESDFDVSKLYYINI